MDSLPKKIAVIVVHGVGDQQPYDSAHKIADLLQSLDAGDPSCEPASPECPAYYPFHEYQVRLDVRPTVVRKKSDAPASANAQAEEGDTAKDRFPDRAGMRGPFDAWVTTRFKEQKEDALSDDDLWYEFTRSQLSLYRGEEPENAYSTIRIEGRRAERKDPNGKQEEARDVHIYELYWADLSRLKAGALSVFTELYQLLLHLPSLGTHVVNAAAAHNAKSGSWRSYKWLQGASAMMLALPILVINLLMLGIVALVLGLTALNKHHDAKEAILASAIALIFVIALGLWMWHSLARHRSKALSWMAPLVVGALFGFLLNYIFCKYNLPLDVIASVLLAGILALALWWVLKKYDARRPGSKRWATFILAVILLAGAVTIVKSPNGPPLEKEPDSTCTQPPASNPSPIATAKTQDCKTDQPASAKVPANGVIAFWVREFEVADIALGISWGAFFGLGLLAVVIGRILAAMADREAQATAPGSRLAYRSWWTGVLMLTIPALSFLIVTSLTWLLIAEAVWKILPSTVYLPLLVRGGMLETKTILQVACVVKTDLEGVVGILLPFAAIALIPAIWGLGPVALQEVLPPGPPRKSTDDAKNQWHDRATRLGHWLTLAFSALKFSGWILFLGTMVFLPLAAAIYVLNPYLSKARCIVESLRGWGFGTHPGWFSWFSGIGLFAFMFFRGRWKSALLGFRYVLDMLLDVDNWLREHPRDSNPKSRICGRYVSLLRYIANWKDEPEVENGVPVRKGYDAIVIIAHSQGTVITADLLKFLKREAGGHLPEDLSKYDEQLAPIADLPIYFFTMGCPLRQLYGLRFPHLYHWARHDSAITMDKWAKGDLQATPPDPTQLLRVTLWENCYRSGDYIGRYLWRTDVCSYNWDPDPCGHPVDNPQQYSSTDGLWRSEFCIGPGAHTHYWDATATVVAKELDRLIATV